MPRSRRSNRQTGRDRSRSLPTRAPSDPFDNDWLDNVRNRPSIRYIDLTRYEDRRLYDPGNVSAWSRDVRPPRGLNGPPRVVVVPENSKLARLQTYGGRYTLDEVYNYARKGRLHPSHPKGWQKAEWTYGNAPSYEYRNYPSHRIGFHLPWQVIICVRRRRRRQVMFALRQAGRGAKRHKKTYHRNAWSEVRC